MAWSGRGVVTISKLTADIDQGGVEMEKRKANAGQRLKH